MLGFLVAFARHLKLNVITGPGAGFGSFNLFQFSIDAVNRSVAAGRFGVFIGGVSVL